MKRLRVVAVILLIAGASVGLAWVVVSNQESFVYDKIVRPLSYAFWVISLLLQGTPQWVFWGFMLLVVFMLSMRSLAGPPRRPIRPRVDPSQYARHARLRFWVRQLVLSRDEHSRFQLDESIGRLALDILAYQRGITLSQYQRQTDLENIEPEFLRPFILARSRPRFANFTASFIDFKYLFNRFVAALPIGGERAQRSHQDLEKVVAFLEQQLDIE